VEGTRSAAKCDRPKKNPNKIIIIILEGAFEFERGVCVCRMRFNAYII